MQRSYDTQKRSEALETISAIYNPESITYSIVAEYMEGISSFTTKAIRAHLLESGIPLTDVQQNISNLKREMVYENLPAYILSATIRVMLVFLATLAAAFILLGKYKFSSFAFGGAFAALLLTWPVISLWDTAVSNDWQSMRGKFLVIYAIYIIAFYFTAKFASLVAHNVRNQLGQTNFVTNDVGAESLKFSFKELGANLFVAIALNSIAFGANLIVPING